MTAVPPTKRAETYASASTALLELEQPKWTRLPIRTRPHRNPLAENDDVHPECPKEFDQQLPEMYPMLKAEGCAGKKIEFLDVGCAFGGMLFDLCAHFPDTLMLGLEIRGKVVDFAQKKALELREGAKNQVASDGKFFHHYGNVWFDALNVMKYGSNCFEKGQLKKIFFCYPDPHWKKNNIRRRIISPGLVQEYAYWLEVGGLIYTVTDVEGLEQWMIQCLDDSPLFERLSDAEIESFSPNHSKVIQIVTSSSEDAQRTQRKGLTKNYAVHKRVSPATPAVFTGRRSVTEV